MTTQTAKPDLAAQPLLGFLPRDIARETSIIYFLLIIALTGVVLAVKAWGIVALAMAALAMVPVMLIILLLITRG